MENTIKGKNLGLKTYEPEDRFEIDKEKAVPWLSYISQELMALGGVIFLTVSGIFMSIKGFFSAKKKIREIQASFEKTLDLTLEGKRKERFKMKLG